MRHVVFRQAGKPASEKASFADASNSAARNTWEHFAVGQQRAHAPQGTREYFDQIRAYRYGYETPFIPRLFEFASLHGKRVLEIGVGHGIDGAEMARAGAHYSGIDITQNHLRLAQRNFELQGLHGEFVTGDLTQVDVPGAPFDLIFSFGVLHHIAHEQECLRRIRERLLAPDGQLRIAVYAKYSFFNAYLVASWLARAPLMPLAAWQSHVAELSPIDAPVTIKIRSRAEVERVLNSAGFRTVQYARRGFVQGNIPIIGRLLHPDGATLNTLGRAFGWYHIFFCRPA